VGSLQGSFTFRKKSSIYAL